MSHAAQLIERHQGKEAMSFLGKLASRRLPPPLQTDLFDLRGQALQALGDFRTAHRAYRSCLKSCQPTSDPWRYTETLVRLGDTARQIEDFHDALRWYRQAEKKARALKSRRLTLDATSGQAMALRGLGKYSQALSVFARLLKAYRHHRDKEGVAYVLWAMGTTARFAGRLREADRSLKEAVAQYEKLRDASGLAYARCGWGGTLRMMGHAARSRQLYAAAYTTFRRQNDQFGMAYASCGQGNGHRMTGALGRALPFMARAEKGYRRLKLYGPLGFVLWSRAQLRIVQENFTAATSELVRARRAFQSARDPRGLVYVTLGEGELRRAQGKPSAPIYRRAERAARRLHLTFELTHARVRAGLDKGTAYRSNGVSIQHFSRYCSLP